MKNKRYGQLASALDENLLKNKRNKLKKFYILIKMKTQSK
ncbi:hypothetical protein DOY81_003780 [Sarcophaga bullata]|nr:hypothetical protein DOY81_003780 [Sarcophaga bullata]